MPTPLPTNRVDFVDNIVAADVNAIAAAVNGPAPVVVTGTTDTLAAADHGATIRYTNAGLVTVTIPTDAADDLPDGFWCGLFAEGGVVTLATGVTLAGSAPNRTIAQNETMVVTKTSTADTWIVTGATSGAITTEPSAPTGLSVVPGDTEATLSWAAAGDGGSPITGYFVEYLPSGGSWTEFVTTGTSKSVTVTGLTNDVSHDFRVSAINGVGTSDVSASVSATPTSPGTSYGLTAATAPARPAWADTLAGNVPVSLPAGAVKVSDYGSPSTDDRTKIVSAITAAGVDGAVDFSIVGGGVWTVPCNGTATLWPINGQVMWIPPDVTIQMTYGALLTSDKRLFRIRLRDGVIITGGGTLKGDVRTSPSNQAEWAHLISIDRSSNTAIVNITLTEAWGDGIHCGTAENTTDRTTNVYMSNVSSTYNRRQAFSPVEVNGLWVEDSEFAWTGYIDVFERGLTIQNPTAGIDFETNGPEGNPAAGGYSVENAHLVRCHIHHNGAAGVHNQNPFGSPTVQPNNTANGNYEIICEAYVWDCLIYDNGFLTKTGDRTGGVTSREGGSTYLSGCYIHSNSPHGVQTGGGSGTRLNQGRNEIRDSRIENNTTHDFVSTTPGHDTTYTAVGYAKARHSIVENCTIGSIRHAAGLDSPIELNWVENDAGGTVSTV